MNKIMIENSHGESKELRLEHGTITLGRAPDNDIQLLDKTVSAHHARIVTIFNASHIEDIGSTNGSKVNGKKINEHTLHDGDVIQLGKIAIRFFSDASVPAANPDTKQSPQISL